MCNNITIVINNAINQVTMNPIQAPDFVAWLLCKISATISVMIEKVLATKFQCYTLTPS